MIFLNPKTRLDQFADLVGIGVVLSGFLVGFCPFDKAREIDCKSCCKTCSFANSFALFLLFFLLVLIPPSVCGRWQALHGPLRQDSLRGMGTGFEHEQYLI